VPEKVIAPASFDAFFSDRARNESWRSIIFCLPDTSTIEEAPELP
jgi:hypothetical protein